MNWLQGKRLSGCSEIYRETDGCVCHITICKIVTYFKISPPIHCLRGANHLNNVRCTIQCRFNNTDICLLFIYLYALVYCIRFLIMMTKTSVRCTELVAMSPCSFNMTVISARTKERITNLYSNGSRFASESGQFSFESYTSGRRVYSKSKNAIRRQSPVKWA